MPEHTPAPTPARAVYGFAVFLLFKALCVVYIFWAYLPRQFVEDTLGLTYLPDKYFAQCLPFVIIYGLWLFAFIFYPALGLSLTPEMDSIDTVRDEFTIRLCEFQDQNGRKCKGTVDPNPADGFYFRRFCPKHVQDNTASPDRGPLEENCSDFCDCPNEENCLIKTNSDYLTEMRLRKRVPTAFDLDIADVCRRLYRN